MLTIFLLTALMVIITIYFLQWKRLRNKLPPGPPPLPLLGNLLQLDKTDMRKTFLKWHKQYGPMYTVWLGTDPQVFVSGYDLLQELFVKQGELFINRPISNAMIFQYATKGNFGVVGANDSMWKEQRRFTLQVLRSFGLGRQIMEEKVLDETEKLLQSIFTKLDGSKNAIIKIQSDLELCVGNIISSVIVDRTYQPGDPTFLAIKHSIDENFRLLASVRLRILNNYPFLRFIPLFGHFGFDDLKRTSEKFTNIIESEMNAHKEQLKNSADVTDFTAAYLQEIKRRQQTGEDMSHFEEWQLICIIRDLWMAGMETTMTTLHWSILFMLHNEDVQRKVQAEIDDILGSDRTPSMADKTRMPYVMAVLQEIQRCANIVPINIGHTVKEDFHYNGYVLPKEIPVIPQIAVVMMDEKIFPEPDRFIPERFLESDGKTLKKVEELMPFSLGKRICLGEGLARMELFLIFVSLLQKFTFSVPKGMPKPSTTPVLGLTLSPKAFDVEIEVRNYHN